MTSRNLLKYFLDLQMILRTLLSSRTAAKAQIIAAVASGLLLSFATWISTVQVPAIQDVIQGKEAAIRGLRDRITEDLVQGLYATDIYTVRRIDLLDVRLERIMVSSKSKREQLLLEDAAKKTVDQIKQWDSLFVSQGSQSISTPIPAFDESTPVERRLTTLDSILSNVRRNAYSRLRNIAGQIGAHESEKAAFEAKLKRRQVSFRISQVLGLVLFGSAIGLESHKKYREIDDEDEESNIRKRDVGSDDEVGVS